MTEFVIYALIFWIGFILGFLAKAWMSYRFREYDGSIRITELEDKTLYSLELDDDPERISSQKELVFRVDVSDVENFDRD